MNYVEEMKKYGVSADWVQQNRGRIQKYLQEKQQQENEAKYGPNRDTPPFYDVETPPSTPQAPDVPGANEGVWDQTNSTYSPTNPFGPTPAEQIQGMASAGSALYDAGFDINRESGARAAEVLYPYQRDAYNRAMQNKALVSGFDSLDEFRNDPVLNATSKMMVDKLANPYTIDDQTVSLMRSRTADQLANQEAAMGERLRAMGATSGISPDSPLYASLAQQATMARDINMANMERQLQIDLAKQRQTDRERAIAMGSQFGGAYQSMLGQKQANIQNLMVGGKVADLGNPFAGLWQGMMAKQQMADYNQLLLGGYLNQGGDGDTLGGTLSSIGGLMSGAGGLMQGIGAL